MSKDNPAWRCYFCGYMDMEAVARHHDIHCRCGAVWIERHAAAPAIAKAVTYHDPEPELPPDVCEYSIPQMIIGLPAAVIYEQPRDAHGACGYDHHDSPSSQRLKEQRYLIKKAMSKLREVPLCAISGQPVTMVLDVVFGHWRLCFICEACLHAQKTSGRAGMLVGDLATVGLLKTETNDDLDKWAAENPSTISAKGTKP